MELVYIFIMFCDYSNTMYNVMYNTFNNTSLACVCITLHNLFAPHYTKMNCIENIMIMS